MTAISTSVQKPADISVSVSATKVDVGVASFAMHSHGQITTDGRIANATGASFLVTSASGLVGVSYSVTGLTITEETVNQYAQAGATLGEFIQDIGAAVDNRSILGHTHLASEISGGVLAIGRIPTGQTSASVCVGNDFRLSNSRFPTSHASTHSSAGTDPITPVSIGAESIYSLSSYTVSGGTTSLTSGRARVHTFAVTSASTVSLPNSTNVVGDRLVIRGGNPVSATLTITGAVSGTDTITAVGQQISYSFQSTGWVKTPVDRHTHSPADLTQSGATTNQALVWNGTAWAPGAVGLADAPSDGTYYARRNSAWVDITSPANLQVRRGTAAEVAAITPLAGEPVWATDTKLLSVGDGSTAGGIQINGVPLESSSAVAIYGTPTNTIGAGAIWVSSKADLASIIYPAGTGSNPHVSGNTRGLGAVDFTNERTSAAQVASGRKAFCGPGSNTASGEDSVAFSGGTASGTKSVAFGGTASGTRSYAFNGESSGVRSYAFGGTADREAMMTLEIANAYAGSLGRGQAVVFGLRWQTTNATPAVMRRDGNLSPASNGYPIPSGVALFGTIQICAIKTADGTQAAHYIRKFAIMNVGGTTSLIGGVTAIGTDHESSAGLDVSVTANDTNDTLEVTVTGLASTTLRWIAVVNGVEQAL